MEQESSDKIYPFIDASRFLIMKSRSPSISRSESASLRLDSGSILSVTDPEKSTPTDTDSHQSFYSAYSEGFALPSIGPGSSESLVYSEATISKLSLLSQAETITRSSLLASPVYTSSSTTLQTDTEDRSSKEKSLLAHPKDIHNAVNLMADDLVIAFMGLTGSGKSNFIDTLTNQPGRRAGLNLESHTDQIRAVRMLQHPEYADRLVFVDTPGFNNTYKSDMEVLQVISDWLKQTYQKNIRLAGIVYLHRITDRMTGAPYRNLQMFGKICGDRAMRKVVLVTTMWDKMKMSTSQGMQRELQLRTKHWKPMVEKGASVSRFQNTSGSAWEIIEGIVQEPTTQVLLLQEELVDLKIRLIQTGAGMALYTELQRLLASQQEAVRLLTEQAMEDLDNNLDLVTQLYIEYNRLQADFENTFTEVKNLKIPIGRRLLRFFTGKKPRGVSCSLDGFGPCHAHR